MNASIAFALLLGLAAMGTGGATANADDKKGWVRLLLYCVPRPLT